MSHAIERTSPKGSKFIGTCTKCGRTDLLMADALKPCPAAHIISDEQGLVEILMKDQPKKKQGGEVR